MFVGSLLLINQQGNLKVEPALIQFQNLQDQVQLRVVDNLGVDFTSKATFKSSDTKTISVSATGEVKPLQSGNTSIIASFGKLTATSTVNSQIDTSKVPTFEKDIQPILTRFGCNSGPCHGKQRGQNGFQLSLLAFDDDFDFGAIVTEARGRRIFPSSPESSILLMKATGAVPHGGGKKLDPESTAYKQLLSWIKVGTPRTPKSEPKIIALDITPANLILPPKTKVQVRAIAKFEDGTSKDVTHLSAFQSSESVLTSVDSKGLIETGSLPGEVAIMARYMEKFAICYVTMPLTGATKSKLPARISSDHFIDTLLSNKFEKLGLSPSEPANDSVLVRRMYLDIIGRLPTPEETRAWLNEKSPDKVRNLAVQLVNRPEYAEFWANKWADLLRPNPYHVGIKAVFVLHTWLRDAFRKNLPYDQFSREIITAEGSTFRDGASVFIRDKRTPEEITTVVSRLFLGVRLECAKCHHHPFEVYGQEDFYQFAAFFARIGRKGVGISAPISGSEEMFFLSKKGTVKHPRTNEEMKPAPLKGKPMEFGEDEDPRAALAKWITSKDNNLFAKAGANRIWGDLMGRGLVDPVDDLRATNPPTNPELLDALAEEFRKSDFDMKKFIVTIVTSNAYRLSSVPNEKNLMDTRNHSRHYRNRPRAEVLLDMVCDVTGVKDSFPAMPQDSRAMEMWTFRSASEFLDSFGRPDPNQDPPCERLPDSTVVQALHLMNGKGVQAKILSDNGRAAQLAASPVSLESAVEELYLRCYSRMPTKQEMQKVLTLASDQKLNKRQALENVLWALINSPEFVLVD